MLTVSRSVDRVFQIMELFSLRRMPLTATEIHQALNMPHSSAVSVLARLVCLGYLDQNSETKRFFPSLRLQQLCDTVPEAVFDGHPLAELVDRVQHVADETTSISRLDGLFTMPLYVRSARHASAWRVASGSPGGLATHSVVGRTLLSTLTDGELRTFMDRSNHWAARTRALASDAEQVVRAVEFVREHGYLCRYNLLFPGVGAISCPVRSGAGGVQLAVTVAGSVERIQDRGRQIIHALLQAVQSWQRRPTGSGLPDRSSGAAAISLL